VTIPGPVATAIGVVLVALGAALLLRMRFAASAGPVRLAVVGRVSEVTQVVMALALIGVGYHALAYANHWTAFRAPMPIVIGVALVAIVGSLLVDTLENRGGGSDDQAGR